MANSVEPDETARDEPSHLDLHFLHRCLFLSAGLNVLISKTCLSSNLIKIYFMTCASSEKSEQPAHLRSPIREFAVRLSIRYPQDAQRRLIRQRMYRLI